MKRGRARLEQEVLPPLMSSFSESYQPPSKANLGEALAALAASGSEEDLRAAEAAAINAVRGCPPDAVESERARLATYPARCSAVLLPLILAKSSVRSPESDDAREAAVAQLAAVLEALSDVETAAMCASVAQLSRTMVIIISAMSGGGRARLRTALFAMRALLRSVLRRESSASMALTSPQARLTSVHADVLALSVAAKAYSFALRELVPHITPLALVVRTSAGDTTRRAQSECVTAADVQLVHYYCCLIYTANNDYRAARHAARLTLAVPARDLSETALRAAKLHILLSLLTDLSSTDATQAFLDALPREFSTELKHIAAPKLRPYLELAERPRALSSGSADGANGDTVAALLPDNAIDDTNHSSTHFDMSINDEVPAPGEIEISGRAVQREAPNVKRTISRSRALFERDGTWGLVKIAAGLHRVAMVRGLAKVYVSLPLREVARCAPAGDVDAERDTASDATDDLLEVEAELTKMAWRREVNLRIDARAALARFDDPGQRQAAAVDEYAVEGATRRVLALCAQLTALKQEFDTDSWYVRTVQSRRLRLAAGKAQQPSQQPPPQQHQQSAEQPPGPALT